jgi:hypothetical protein
MSLTKQLHNGNPANVFYAYAREDETFLRQLEAHLSPLQEHGLISGQACWQISPGLDQQAEMNKCIEQAHIILLLVSADFLSSRECHYLEQRALAQQILGSSRVAPIIIRPCAWRQTSFGYLTPLPRGGLPVTKWGNSDEAFLTIAEGIQHMLRGMGLNIPIFQEQSSSRIHISEGVGQQIIAEREGLVEDVVQEQQDLSGIQIMVACDHSVIRRAKQSTKSLDDSL